MGTKLLTVRIFDQHTVRMVNPEADSDCLSRIINGTAIIEEKAWVPYADMDFAAVVDDKNRFFGLEKGIDGSFYVFGKIFEDKMISFAYFYIDAAERQIESIRRNCGEKKPSLLYLRAYYSHSFIGAIFMRRKYLRSLEQYTQYGDGGMSPDFKQFFATKMQVDECVCEGDGEKRKIGIWDYKVNTSEIGGPFRKDISESERAKMIEESKKSTTEHILGCFDKLPPWRKSLLKSFFRKLGENI